MFRRLILFVIVCAALGLGRDMTAAAEIATNSESAAVNTVSTPASAGLDTDALLRSVLILQEQLKNTQREIQQAREEADLAARRTSDLLTERLNFIEQKQIETMQSSNHLTLTVVGIIAAIACMAVVLSGWVQMRAVTRLADISRQLECLPALMSGSVRQLGNGEATHPTPAAQLGSGQVAAGLSRLHDRLDDLAATANGSRAHGVKELPTTQSRAATAIAKGQALLNLEKPEEALAAFEEAISTDPANIEAWVKKGAALERLQRIEEALAAYDKTIELDESTATAYLFKAGVYNRQKRYAEALECYEKALNVQKSRAARAG